MDDLTQIMGDATDLIRTVANLAAEADTGWETWGPPEDRVQLATITFQGVGYTLLRGNGVFMAFTPLEWDAFQDGVEKGEFNKDAGIPASQGEEEKPHEELV